MTNLLWSPAKDEFDERSATPLFDQLMARIEADYASLPRSQFLRRLSLSIKDNKLPLACGLAIGEKALQRGDSDVIETILVLLDTRGDEHPLLDQLRANYWVAAGERRKALELLVRCVEKWNRPYLWALKENLEKDGDTARRPDCNIAI